MKQLFISLAAFSFATISCGCSLQPKQTGSEPTFKEITANPLPPDQAKDMVSEVGGNWLYGQGLGDAGVIVGSTVAFPPMAIWWIGNAVISLSGYEPLRVSDALPEKSGKVWRETYDNLASGPGRMAAAIAGKEYRSEEIARERLEPYLQQAGNASAKPALQVAQKN